MATKLSNASAGIVILTPDEIRQTIDLESRERLGVSGETFLARWLRRELPDSDATADIAILARLLELEPPQSV